MKKTMNMNHLGAMAVFAQVVDSGGFSAAANVLGITRSAASQRVKQLELQLGVDLLRRNTRSLSLTEAGELTYRHCKAMTREAEVLEQGLASLQGQIKGQVSIACPGYFGVKVVAPILAEFNRLYPDVTIRVSFQDRSGDMIAEGFDLAVRAGPLVDSSLKARLLLRSERVLCAASGYFEQAPVVRGVGDLEALKWIVYEPSRRIDSTLRLSRDGRSYSFNPIATVVTDSAEARLAFVLAGCGVAFLPEWNVEQCPELDVIRTPFKVPPLETYLLKTPVNTANPVVDRLGEYLLEKVAEYARVMS